MTTASLNEVAKPRIARTRTRATVAGTLRAAVRALLEETSGIRWPSDRYRNDPCAFAEEILGVTLWAKQREILEAIRDHKRVSVRSGHKIGKSHTAAIIALWFYCSFEDARVVFSSVTARQVDAILWRELGKMLVRAGVCNACRAEERRTKKPAARPCAHSALIDGEMHKLARSGFRAKDFREVSGFTAREAEAVAGISGANLLYLLDEASGIEDAIFEAMQGNRAGGARLVMFSNPTRTEGEFFASQTEKALKQDAEGNWSGLYCAIHVSSEETPNAIEDREVIPGLAGREWIEEMRAEYGEDSAFFKVRVKGEFVLGEDGKILSIHAITAAEARWSEAPMNGRLVVAIDPSGPGLAGDDSAFAVRRALRILEVHRRRALTEDGHLTELVGLLAKHRRPGEPVPIVIIDREGPIGARLYGHLRAYVDQPKHRGAFIVVGIRSSEKARRKPDQFERVRDELWANFADWVHAGGGIPTDVRLSKELHAPAWIGQVSGKLKATPKSELRTMLDGRSPDGADACCLAVWDLPRLASVVHEAQLADAAIAPEPETDLYDCDLGGIDPYALDGAGR